MICVFLLSDTTLSGAGAQVLMPISAKVRQVAGGEYSFTMEHPIDPWGKWTYLVREAVIRLPIPKETIPAAYIGTDTDVYVTNTSAALRDGPSEPSTITYSSWVSGTSYAVGSKVTSNSKNYQLIAQLTGNEIYTNPSSSAKWKSIARQTSGAAVLVTLKTGQELYYVSTYDSTWYQMTTTYGLTGFIKKSQVTYSRHISPSDVHPRTITEQLFRIKDVKVDRKNGVVSVSGNHVSNDLNGVLVKNVEVVDVSPGMAISKMTEAFMTSYRGTIATNITDVSYGTYTGTIKLKNAMFCLTDPDVGIVPKFDARFTRDNWDLFVMYKSGIGDVFTLRYAKNVNGIIWRVKTNNLITRVVPVAKAENGEDLYLPEVNVDSFYISNYPVIYMEGLNVKGQVGKETETGSGTTWTETELYAEMRTKARDRFLTNKVDIPVTEVTVQLELLEDTEEYKWMKGLEELVLYDEVQTYDPDIGLNIQLEVSEIEYDCIKKKITGMKITNNMYEKDKSVSGFNIVNGSLTMNKIDAGTKSDLISDAVDAVLNIIE